MPKINPVADATKRIVIKISNPNGNHLIHKIEEAINKPCQKIEQCTKESEKALFATLLATSVITRKDADKEVKPLVTTPTHTSKVTQRQTSEILSVEDKSFIYSVWGKNKISFDDANADLGIDLNETHFKLPKGAKPDKYQIAAAQNLHLGNTTIVSAPTGTGKTAIANYVISKNLAEGERTFFLTPLKALSNDKLNEFRAKYGAENVGILTGDRKENANAPIVIMTTEVYCNMVSDNYFKNKTKDKTQAQTQNFKQPKTIIYDEVHYISDPDRGLAWEISMMCTPKTTQILGLSATIGNDVALTNWIGRINSQSPRLIHVPSEARHVPIEYEKYDIPSGKIDILENDSSSFVKHFNYNNSRNNYEKRLTVEDYLRLINSLHSHKKTPSILYVLSKNNSKKILQAIDSSNVDLTSNDEKEQIKKIYNEHIQKHGYLGKDINLSILSKGVAIHNSGILPVAKELVEELFRKKLLKVVIATETLAAGINMPARSCVMTTAEKPCSDPDAKHGKREFTPNEFAQAAGRAGRRGFDDVGYCILVNQNSDSELIFNKLIHSSPNDLISRFTIDYSQISNYHKRFSDSNIMKEFIANSFRFYQEKEKNPNYKINEFIKLYEKKCKLLEKEEYLKSLSQTDKKLTTKGKLLHNIIGYQQIPLINTISNQLLQKLTPEELIFFAAAIVSGQYNIKENEEENETQIEAQKPSTVIKSNLRSLEQDKMSNLSPENLDNVMDAYNLFNENYKGNLGKFNIYDVSAEKTNLEFAGLVHSFAYLNSKTQNESVDNWQQVLELLSENGPIKDEGSLYNAINQTGDLISQMIDLCNATSKIPELQNDRQYYRILAAKLKTAMLLLKQAPIEDYKYEH